MPETHLKYHSMVSLTAFNSESVSCPEDLALDGLVCEALDALLMSIVFRFGLSSESDDVSFSLCSHTTCAGTPAILTCLTCHEHNFPCYVNESAHLALGALTSVDVC